MPRRTTAQRESDLVALPKRYIFGDPLSEIAKDFGVSEVTVFNDIEEVRRRWLANSVQEFDVRVAEQLARIDILEIEYLQGWQRSQEAEETRVKEKKVKASIDGEIKLPIEEKSQTRSKSRAGDPRFLEGVERCIDKRCKLFGLYAPSRVDIQWRDELTGQGIDPDAVFEEVVEKYINEMEEAIQDPSLPVGVKLQIEGGTGVQEYVTTNADDNEEV